MKKILYHANCVDGMGAALAAWMKFGDDNCEYIPVQYGQPLPNGLDGELVFMLDFSVKHAELKELASRAKMVWVIDHHASAERELSSIESETSNVGVIFNMDKSGAVLAWDYFHKKPVPKLFEYIQDRDLWRFDMQSTNAVHASLQLYTKNFRYLELYIDKPEQIGPDLISTGQAIVDYLDQQSTKIVESETNYATIAEETVPAYSLVGFMISDTLHKALDKHALNPFVVAYFDVKGKRVYSLRSRKGSDVDVGKIAAQYGGGGHKHAAGFTVPLGDIEV